MIRKFGLRLGPIWPGSSPQSSSGIAVRGICTTQTCTADVSAKYKRTHDQSLPLTYEQYNKPLYIGRRKGWLSMHTSNLEGFEKGRTQRPIEDEVIRRMLNGIFYDLWVNQLIIKRRGNMIAVAGLMYPRMAPRLIYWKIGFAEELLSLLLKQPVKLEIQTVNDRKDVIFKYV